MKLKDCELVPAVIQSTDDPLKLGRIKCDIPGLVDHNTMSIENMPWIRPIFMNRSQTFSKPVVGFKVWVLINKSNYNEYWYFPFFELNDISKEFLESVYDSDNPEIFMSHNNGSLNAMSTYDDQNGFTIKIGEHHIELHPDGHISLLGGSGEVDIDGSHIKVGKKDGNYEHAVMGDSLKEILEKLHKGFNKLKQDASSDSHTAKLIPGFQECQSALSDLDPIIAENTKVN